MAIPAGPVPGNGDGEGSGGMTLPVTTVSPSGSPSVLSAHPQSDIGQRSGPENSDCLSKEQLEHRERSLRTLRDIERLLLRSGAIKGHGNASGTSNNPSNDSSTLIDNNSDGSVVFENNGTNNTGSCSNDTMLSPTLAPVGRMKGYEEPLQSMISQTQSLCGPTLDSAHHNLPQHHHHQLTSPVVDTGSFPELEGLTPEQMAWRKLQEEYYLEKRRQQELQPQVHPQHLRMMSEIGMHGGTSMVRGPPPPYHKTGEQQWVAANMLGRRMCGNTGMIDMQQHGPRGPRFLGQMQRGTPGGDAFPGNAGGRSAVECPGPQKPTRLGIVWLEDIPNNIGDGGRFQGCYPSGPPQQLQGDPEHPLIQEEIFSLMQKRQMQGLPRFELDRLAKLQQQGNLGSRILDNPGGQTFPNLEMVQGPPSSRVDPMDFPGSLEIMCSSGGGPQRTDLVDSALRRNLMMNMNPQMNVQQQQQIMLSQKLQDGPAAGGHLGEIYSHGAISQTRATQNERGGNQVVRGRDGPFHFPNQGPFTGGQMEGPCLQRSGPGMFGPERQSPKPKGVSLRLCHVPMVGGLSGVDRSPWQPSDLSISVDHLTSPSMPPPHNLKSPSLNQEPFPLQPSPSAPGLKSPLQVSSAGHHPALPPASGAGTPSSSMKSPQMLGSSNLALHSPSTSPAHLKSPAVTVASPGWASPKTALSSPGGPTSGKLVGNGGNSSIETGKLRNLVIFIVAVCSGLTLPFFVYAFCRSITPSQEF